MQKIISLFKRNYENKSIEFNGEIIPPFRVYNEVVPGAEWVLAGEGTPTRKLDGTCCRIKDGILYKRFELKQGKTPPGDFEPAQAADPITGDQPGWVIVDFSSKEDRWFTEAANNAPFGNLSILGNGTYELVGPKINGNKDEYDSHQLIKHGSIGFPSSENPRTFDDIKSYLSVARIEGIVWHHPDGRMVKIKARDFGIKW